MSKKLTTCKACGKEVSKSAKKCPHCGQKLKMGFFKKAFIGIFVVIVAIVAIIIGSQPSKEDKAKEIQQITTAPIANINPSGETREIFKLGSKYTDVQRENKEKEIKGKIVQWNLKIYEVKRYKDYYKVQTSGKNVGTFISITPRNEQEKKYLEGLRTGDFIKFKGKIKGVFMRNIEIEPAVLVQ